MRPSIGWAPRAGSIYRTDITPGLEGVAGLLPPGVDVVLSCYRLYGPEFTAKVLAARGAWERAVVERRRTSNSS